MENSKASAPNATEVQKQLLQRLDLTTELLRKLCQALDANTKETSAINAAIHRQAEQILSMLDSLGQKLRDTLSAVKESQHSDDEGPLAPLKTIAEISIVLGALLYSTGFGYMYRYYKAFGLTFSDLNIPFNETLMFFFAVASNRPKWTAVCVVLIALPILVAVLEQKKNILAIRHGALMLLLVLPVWGYSFFWLGSRVGEDDARGDITKEESTCPVVKVILTTDLGATQQAEKPDDDQCKPTYDCHLLLHANGRYYLFRPVSSNEVKKEGLKVPVFIIPEHRVRSIQIQSGPWNAHGR